MTPEIEAVLNKHPHVLPTSLMIKHRESSGLLPSFTVRLWSGETRIICAGRENETRYERKDSGRSSERGQVQRKIKEQLNEKIKDGQNEAETGVVKD